MILTKKSIVENVKSKKINIYPFDNARVKKNSYTVTLGNRILCYDSEELDTSVENSFSEIIIPDEGYLLKKNQFYVGHIVEYIGSDYFVPLLHGIPSIAFRGLFIHITANLIDIGNHCNFSLQIYPTENIVVYPGMEIAQVSFWDTYGAIELYRGKYKNVRGPVASKSYKQINLSEQEDK